MRGRDERQFHPTQVFPQLFVLRAVALAREPGAANVLGRQCGCAGLGHAAACHRRDHDASGRATGPCPAADRRASPFHPSVPYRLHDGARTPRGLSAAEMVAGTVARGHGQKWDRDLDPVDRSTRDLVMETMSRNLATLRGNSTSTAPRWGRTIPA